VFEERASNAGAQQHQNHHPIEQILYLRHSLVPILQHLKDMVIPFSADSLMDSKVLLDISRHQSNPLKVLAKFLRFAILGESVDLTANFFIGIFLPSGTPRALCKAPLCLMAFCIHCSLMIYSLDGAGSGSG